MRSTAVGFALAFIFGLSVLPIDAKKCKDLQWPGGSSLSGFENLPYTVILEIKSKTPLVTCLVIGADTIDARVDPARTSFNNGQGVGYPSDRYTKVFNRDRCASGQFFDWARGHLMAARYFGHHHAATSKYLQAQTYFTFNVIPMLQQCNNGWWKNYVEAAVRKYMNLPGTRGDRVFVGTFGEQPDRQFSKGMPAITATKSEEPQHRRIMWTAVCPKDGSGFYFVGGYPNNVDCGPHLPKRSTIYANVVKQLEKECGGKSRSWQDLLVRPTAPSLAFGRSIPNAKSSRGPRLPQILPTSGSRRGSDHIVNPKNELLPPIQLSSSASLGGGGTGHLAGHSIAGSTLGSTPPLAIGGDGGQSTLGGGVYSGGGPSSHIGHFRFDDQGNKYRIPFQGDRGLRDSAFRIANAKKGYHMGAGRSRFHPFAKSTRSRPEWRQRK